MPRHSFILVTAMLFNLFVAAVCFLVFGYYYEEYQSLFHSFLSQAMSPGVVFNSWYYQGYIGISRLIARLYLFLPSVEWLSWISYALLVASSWVITYLFVVSIRQKVSRVLLPLIQITLALVLLSDNILHLQNARVSHLAAGAGCLLLVLKSYSVAAIKNDRWSFIGGTLLVVSGGLLRLEPLIGVVYLMFPFALVWHKNVTKAISSMLAPATFALLLFLVTMVDLKTSHEFHKQVEPDVEMQLTVRNNIVPLATMKTPLDSIKYEAAKNMLWGDPKVITVNFLRSLIDTPPYTVVTYAQIKRTLAVCAEYFNDYRHFTLLLLLLAIVIAYSYYAQKHITTWGLLRLFFFLSVFLAGIFLQTYYVKMRPWSFSPLFSLFFTAWGLLLFKERFCSKPGSVFIGVFCLLIIGCIVSYMVNATQRQQQMFSYNQTVRNTILPTVKGETLLINPSSYQSFLSSQQPFEKFSYSNYQKLFFYESQIASILPGYREYLMQECHCDVYNFSQFYSYLLSPAYGHKVYALSTEKRMSLITRYLRIVYGVNFPFEQTPLVLPTHPIDNHNRLFLYELKKLSAGR